MTAVDRTPKPCRHRRANHQHGTHLAYDKDLCRCWSCVTAHSRQDHDERYRTATGTHSYVPAESARVHVQQLLDVLTVSQIEQRSDVHRTAIRVLIGDFPGRPASKRITRTTEHRLLAVQATRIGPERHGLVDATGTRRRLRALVALGWPAAHLGSRLGCSSRTTWGLTRPDAIGGGLVLVATRDAVRRLYDELCLTAPPPSRVAARVRALASARDWPPPLAWDDDSIDDPTAHPAVEEGEDSVDELAVDAVLDAHSMPLSGATLLTALTRMDDAGYPIAVIAHRLKIPEYQVGRLRGRATVPPRFRTRAS